MEYKRANPNFLLETELDILLMGTGMEIVSTEERSDAMLFTLKRLDGDQVSFKLRPDVGQKELEFVVGEVKKATTPEQQEAIYQQDRERHERIMAGLRGDGGQEAGHDSK